MKIWIDDIRKKPEGYDFWCRSVNGAMQRIVLLEKQGEDIELLDLDHDAGGFAADGGDYIRLLDWLEATGRNYPIRVHSMNPVGRQNMLAIAEHNRWKIIG